MDSICLWPDGEWCYVEYIHEYSWKSDDFKVYVLPIDRETEEDIQKYLDFLQES